MASGGGSGRGSGPADDREMAPGGDARGGSASSGGAPAGTSGGARSPAALPRRSRGRRWAVAALLLVLLALGSGTAVVLQTTSGQALVLDAVLDRVRGSFAGELRVGGVRSGMLLTGATLEDVTLTDADGRHVLSADSLVVRYLPTGLLAGTPRLRSAVLWGLDLVIARYADGGALNLSRVLAPAAPPPDSTGAVGVAPAFMVTHIGVRDGTISVLTPAAGQRGRTVVPGPEGPLDRLGMERVSLDLEDVSLRLGEEEVASADLAALAMRLALPFAKEPLEITEAFGRVTYGDAGLHVSEGLFRLPGTLVGGSVGLGPPEGPGSGGWGISADLRVDEWGRLEDLRWLDPRVPTGSFRGAATIAMHGGADVQLDGVEIRLPASNVTVTGGITTAGGLRLRSLAVTASPLVLSRLEPWLDRSLPLDGWLSGRANFSGPIGALDVDGRVTLVPSGFGGRPTTADYAGRVHLDDELGWTDFEARLEPLNYALVRILAPDLDLDGRGSARVELEGRVDGRIGIVAEVEHVPEGMTTASRIFARGTLERSADTWLADLSGDVAPLSLAAFAHFAPEAELRGLLRGPVTASGPLEELAFTASLAADQGIVDLTGSLDLRDPASHYRLGVEAEALALSTLTARAPDPSEWSGSISVDGSGLTLDELEGSGSIEMYGTRVGRLAIDSLAAHVRAVDGVLFADTLFAALAGASIRGRGELGLRSDREGSATIEFETESLLGFRPLFMGDSLLVRDEMSTLELEFLRSGGIDPDTLPTAEEVRMEGALEGTAELSGRLEELDLTLSAHLIGGAFRSDGVDSLRLELAVSDLPSTRGRWELDAEASGLVWAGRSFTRAAIAGQMVGRAGDGSIQVERGAVERYAANGAFALDSLGGSVELADAIAVIEGQTWTLAGPSGVRWSAGVLSVDDVEVRREGPDPMRMTAAGTIARGGDSDFHLDVDGLHLDRISVVTQADALDLGGHMDLAVDITGPAESPRVSGVFEVLEPRFRNMRLSRIEGSLEYGDRLASVRVDAWDGERRALTGSGTVPIDLSLQEVETRQVEQPMDLHVEADSLGAALALAYFQSLQEVDGTVSASVELRGTTRDPIPSGSVELEGASWTVEALGVRHEDVSGTLTLTPDQNVDVRLRTRGQGASDVTGTIGLSPLSDPTLDLDIVFDRFRAMQRRDMDGTISGALHLGGSYQRPLVEGTVTVDEGTLFVEEFSRSAGVVDLSDPRLFTQGLAVDTTVFMTQPILADIRNPFLDNLRLDVDLAVPRNMWLRSTTMNVEMGGELLVRYDRSASDLVLVGELQALRGTYLVLGRTFEVDEGVVSFIGTPGVNPTLAITASTRIRPLSDEDDPVQVIATAEGTLVQPRVTLTSEDGELSQSDLISYMVFSRAAADLGRNQQSALSTVGGGVTYLTSSFISQFGGVVAQNLGLDYLAVSSPDVSGGFGELRGTQLEIGQYIGDQIFVMVVLRAGGGGEDTADENIDRFGGVRVEWALTDAYNVEAFIEDRLLRSGVGGLATAGLGDEQILGILLFREWGYND